MIPSAMISEPPKPFDSEHGDQATYIVNVQTGDNAAQISDIDRLEIVTTNEKGCRHSQVSPCVFKFKALRSNYNAVVYYACET